jgi:hypothetical protein
MDNLFMWTFSLCNLWTISLCGQSLYVICVNLFSNLCKSLSTIKLFGIGFV